MPKSRKSRSRRRRKRGGTLEGAPTNYELAGSWPSTQSLSQGGEFFKYHEGQHGGQAPLSAIGAEMLPGSLVGPAHLSGLNNAYAQIAGLSDMNGGRRRRKSKKAKKGGRRHKKGTRRHRKTHGGKRRKHGKRSRKHRRARGGAMGYAPFPAQGMLLSGTEYAQAGLNPEWQNAQEFDSAMARESM